MTIPGIRVATHLTYGIAKCPGGAFVATRED